MIRAIGIALALAAGAATAGEPMDCYNDESETDTRYTSVEPEVLRVTDADISVMLIRIRQSENRFVADTESGSPLHLSLSSEKTASR